MGASTVSHAKSSLGGNIKNYTAASATTIEFPAWADTVYVTGTTACTTLRTPIQPGRRVTFVGTDATGNQFTDTAGASTEGAFEIGSNTTLALNDTLVLLQLNSGAWVKVGGADN